MKLPLISVIVPIYNTEKYLDECVESIVLQDYSNLEIILINDGSTDKSLDICQYWAQRDTRIKIINQANGGVSKARNAGLAVAKGDCIAFVDSDDKIDKNYFTELIRPIIDNDVDMVCCRRYSNDIETGEIVYPLPDKKYEFLTDKESFMKMVYHDGNSFVVMWTKLFRREVFHNVLFPEGKNHEDVGVIHRLVWNCGHIASIDEALYFYRKRKNSIMTTVSSKDVLDEISFIKEHYLFWESKEIESLTNEAKRYFCHFFRIRWKNMDHNTRKMQSRDYFNISKDLIHSGYFSWLTRMKFLVLMVMLKIGLWGLWDT